MINERLEGVGEVTFMSSFHDTLPLPCINVYQQ